ncbi:MAG TPA: ion channel [Myxococcota bacterium]|nr:ion channel [Myxococcota bacterium]
MTLPDDKIDVLLPLTVGGATILCTILIHAIAAIGIVHLARRARLQGIAGVYFSVDVILVSAAAFIAFGAHLIETVVWALVFLLCGEFVHFSPALYHSATNYTTLGYGDIILSAPWRLLGPLEAADGMLLFGLSTAILFAVIQRFVHVRLHTEQL